MCFVETKQWIVKALWRDAGCLAVLCWFSRTGETQRPGPRAVSRETTLGNGVKPQGFSTCWFRKFLRLTTNASRRSLISTLRCVRLFIKQNSGDCYCLKADGRTSLSKKLDLISWRCVQACPFCEWQLHVLCVSSLSNSDLCSQLIVFACLCSHSKVNMKHSFYFHNVT